MLSLHPTGEFFRASILRDREDGTVDLQYVQSILGTEEGKTKKEILSLHRGQEDAAVWLKVG